MRVLAVGGHTRNIGKSSLVVDLIRALPEAAWTAVKITQYGHGARPADGQGCGCAPEGHPFALDEEPYAGGGSDTSRFLAAGAARSLWLRVREGSLAEALPALRDQLRNARNVIVESNTLLHFLEPELYLVVLEPRQKDFKKSARRFLERADAFVLRSPLPAAGAWPGIPNHVIEQKPCFLQPLGEALPEPLVETLRSRFSL